MVMNCVFIEYILHAAFPYFVTGAGRLHQGALLGVGSLSFDCHACSSSFALAQKLPVGAGEPM